jgi:hypothetical protein
MTLFTAATEAIDGAHYNRMRLSNDASLTINQKEKKKKEKKKERSTT